MLKRMVYKKLKRQCPEGFFFVFLSKRFRRQFWKVYVLNQLLGKEYCFILYQESFYSSNINCLAIVSNC